MFLVIDILFRLRIISPLSKFAEALEKFDSTNPEFNVEGVTFESNEFNRIKYGLINNAIKLQKMKLENELIHKKNKRKLREKEAKLSSLLNQLKEAQVALITEEKISSAKVILSSVSHELKNPINIAINSTHVLKDFYDDKSLNSTNPKVEPLLNNIVKSNNKMVNIIDTMLLGNNFNPEDRIDVNLKSQIEQSYEDALAVSGVNNLKIDFFCTIDSDLLFNGHKLELNRLFINIFQNSIYAIKKKGHSDSYIKVSAEQEEDNFVLKFEDNGIGIKEEHLEKVLIPFFTTKPNGEGVGLGLHLIKEVVKQHNGELKVSSEYKKYTNILISLPIESTNKV